MSLATRKIPSKGSLRNGPGPRRLNSGSATPKPDAWPLGVQDDTCPVCKSDRYLNPNMKLLISKCYHKMCESCIDRIFTLGPGPCPVCGQALRKSEFSVQTFDDLGVEKEVKIRRELNKKLNRRAEDFPNLRAYNDWLEFVENLAFNLIYDVDVADTEAQIAQYATENSDSIARNNARNQSETAQRAAWEERERAQKAKIREAYLAEQQEEEAQKKMDKSRLIDELAYSGRDAESIVAKSKKTISLKRSSARKHDTFNSTVDAAMASWRFDDPHKEEVEEDMSKFDPIDSMYEDIGGFTRAEKYDDPSTNHLYSSIKAHAGGFLPQFTHQRALEDAFTGLLVTPRV